MALPAGRKGVLPSELTPEGKLKVPSELPSYSSSDEGKMLSVDSEGNLEFTTPPTELPSYSSSDEGKVLSVDSSGELEFTTPEKELPSYSSSDEGKVLSVDSSGDLEFTTPQAGGKIYLHMLYYNIYGLGQGDNMYSWYSTDPTPITTGEAFRLFMYNKGFNSKERYLPAIGKDLKDNTSYTRIIGIYGRFSNDSPTDSRFILLKENLDNNAVWDIPDDAPFHDNVFEL